MKTIIVFALFLFFAHGLSAQWTIQNIFNPNGDRMEDVFFVNDTLGWVAGGGSGKIFKTENAGATWTTSFITSDYLRSIEFATPQLGFCGSLDNRLYKTTDGGTTWTDVANTISPVPEGICGISAPTANVIYGCGVWSNPAYVIKSTDGGDTWTSIDMSAYALSLVDIYFVNENVGFVIGRANPIADGGVILHTTDGGITWNVLHKTMVPQDYVWKIQSPDGINYFASIQGDPSSGNVRMLKSVDAGQTWQTIVVNTTYSWVQTVGFLTSNKGWTGGEFTLYKTDDGGTNWQQEFVGNSYNRFFRINDYIAYLSGSSIYKFVDGDLGMIEKEDFKEFHAIEVSPNPASSYLNIQIDFSSTSQCELNLISTDGTIVKSIYKGMVDKGLEEYEVSLNGIASQTLFLTLQTNEGLYYRTIVVNN